MGQRASTGYLFLVNVLFRPSLMVVGFMLGAMMCEILTTYVTNLYPAIIANASADSFTGLIKLVAYISAFVIILQMVVNVSFQAIRYVPDQVLGWLGGNQTNQVGANAADEVGGAAKGAFVMSGSMRGDVNGDGPLAAARKKRQAAQAKPGGADGAKPNPSTTDGGKIT